MRAAPLVLALLAPLVATSTASAGETPAETPPRSWYGYQTLVADGSSIAGGVATGGVLFLPGYLLAAPIVHALHGRPLRGVLDLGLRLAMPLAGAVLVGGGEYLATKENGLPLVAFSVLGAASGAIAAIAVDAAVLAWDETPARKPNAFTISPTVRFFGKDKTLGLAGMW